LLEFVKFQTTDLTFHAIDHFTGDSKTRFTEQFSVVFNDEWSGGANGTEKEIHV